MNWLRMGLRGACVAAVVCTAGTAMGQQSVGADVTVGELPDRSNNTGAGGIDSFAIGTTSCNKGNVPLNWFTGGGSLTPTFVPGDNRHPVISQNVYRLHNGRFEHIGQAWLKHGFTALQGNICVAQFGFPCSATAGTTLGIGCSDPYSSGLNNGQSGLGPKWQVNASTGLAPFPFAGRDQNTFTTHERRMQVSTADLDATTFSGARFFVESQYVAGDDAAAGNDNNNNSYREVTITGSGSEFTLDYVQNSTTQREKPAIQAWKDVDASVTIVNLDITGDGRFILAAKVTQSGPNFTYEYALQNINSHRSAASFTVPFPAGANPTNVGFHQPAYHSGEPNQGQAPWASSTSATQISWAGPAYAGTPPVYTVSGTDPNRVTGFTAGTGNDHSGNALRWGTLYNFRFTTTVAPATGGVQIGMFRPGTQSAFTLNVPTPGGATIGVATGNCCTGGVCSVTTQAACTGTFGTVGASCNPDPCNFGSCCATNGACSFVTQGSCVGTWTQAGSCTPNICPAPTGACCIGTACSVVTQANCTGGSYGGDGTACSPTACIDNNLCSAARPLCDGVAVTGSTASATFSDAHPATCGQAATSPDVWFTYTPSGTSGTVSVSIDTCGSTFDTVISAYSGVCGSLVQLANGCNDDSAAACGTGSLQSRVTVTLARGVAHRIRVAGFQGATGDYTVRVVGGTGTGCNPPTGVCCISGACSVVTQAACTGSWTAGGSCSPNPCTVVTGSCCSAGNCAIVAQTACNGVWTSGGSCTPNPCPPLNDDCANRAGLGLGTTPFNNTTATTDGIVHNPTCLFSGSDQIFRDIWYNHPSQANGTLVIDTCGSAFDTKIAVYDGFGCLDYVTRLIACNDDDNTCGGGSNLQSKVTIPVTAGGFYTIRVGGWNASSAGAGQLTLTFVPTPVNGSCCVRTACSVSTQAACTGTWTSGGACGPVGNPTTCCPVNFDGVDGVTINDVFAFLNAWFANDAAADFNGGGVAVQDIFDFLNAWFTGC